MTDFTAAYVAVEDVDDSTVGHCGTEAGVRKLACRKQHVFHQESGGGCRRMRPGHCLESGLCVPFSVLTLLVR